MNPRFPLCLYVPESTSPSERSPLLVLVHGTTRRDKSPGDPVYAGGVNDESTTRVDKLKRLRDALDAFGSPTRLDVVEGAAHYGPAMGRAVTRWLASSDAVLNPCGGTG